MTSTLAHTSWTGTAQEINRGRLDQLARELDMPGGGFTFDPLTGHQVRSGFALSVYPERERQIGDRVTGADLLEYLLDNADLLAKPGMGAAGAGESDAGRPVLGGWRDGTSGIAYLDVSIVVYGRDRAEALAAAHDQLAYFDLTNGVEVRLDGAEAA